MTTPTSDLDLLNRAVTDVFQSRQLAWAWATELATCLDYATLPAGVRRRLERVHAELEAAAAGDGLAVYTDRADRSKTFRRHVGQQTLTNAGYAAETNTSDGTDTPAT